MLSKDALTKKRQPKVKKVNLPDLAEEGMNPEESHIFVRKFDGFDRLELAKVYTNRDVFFKEVLLRGISNENGERLFNELSEIDAMMAADGSSLQTIFENVMELNNLGETATADTKKN